MSDTRSPMVEDLDRLAREALELRREDEPHRPRLTRRQVLWMLLTSETILVASALVLGEPAVEGAMLVLESWRRR